MESVVKDICEGLNEKGHSVTVLCSNDKASYSEEKINGVNVIRLPRFGTVFGQCINPSLASKLLSIVGEMDLVHVHCPNPLGEMAALLIPKHIPIVATYHSDVVRQKLLLNAYTPWFKKFLNRVERIYVPTENHITFSKFLPGYRVKCEVVPFGIRETYLEANKKNLEFATKYRREVGPYALFVGRLVAYKGIPVLLKAAKELNQSIIIVGDGPDKKALMNRAKELGVSDKVHFLGKVLDDDEFVGLYHGCEMLVLPSITPNENFGVVQLEAMACGKPVVTTNLKSGVPVVGLKGKTCLIVEPCNSSQLASSMTMIFENKELKNKLGNAGKKRFKEQYTWSKMITTQIKSYKRVSEMKSIIYKHSSKDAA